MSVWALITFLYYEYLGFKILYWTFIKVQDVAINFIVYRTVVIKQQAYKLCLKFLCQLWIRLSNIPGNLINNASDISESLNYNHYNSFLLHILACSVKFVNNSNFSSLRMRSFRNARFFIGAKTFSSKYWRIQGK